MDMSASLACWTAKEFNMGSNCMLACQGRRSSRKNTKKRKNCQGPYPDWWLPMGVAGVHHGGGPEGRQARRLGRQHSLPVGLAQAQRQQLHNLVLLVQVGQGLLARLEMAIFTSKIP